MFIRQHQRFDFADTRAAATSDSFLTRSSFNRLESIEAIDQMLTLADAADRTLLRLVACAAAATLVLAVASSIGV